MYESDTSSFVENLQKESLRVWDFCSNISTAVYLVQ